MVSFHNFEGELRLLYMPNTIYFKMVGFTRSSVNAYGKLFVGVLVYLEGIKEKSKG